MEEEDYILFESYLSEELSKDELLAFESKLKTDPNFDEAFNTYKELNSFLEYKISNEAESDAFKSNLKTISEAHFNKKEAISEIKSTSKSFNFYKYAIAACIILFLGIFTFNQFSSPQYGDYANYDSISLTVRGESNDLLKTAENAFNNKEFVKAEEAFKSLMASEENNSELKLYRAISNIELNNFEIADGLLEDLRVGNSAFKNKATWYLALSKLKQNDEAGCMAILKMIPQDGEDYKRAQKLIDKLD